MNLEVAKKNQRKAETANFWRALSFLGPHWRIVTASILSALLVGALFTSGLTTILPIVQVLIKGDTVQAWVDRQIVASRLNVRLADDPQHVTVSSAKAGGAMDRAGVNYGEIERVTGLELPAESAYEKPSVREQRRASTTSSSPAACATTSPSARLSTCSSSPPTTSEASSRSRPSTSARACWKR